MLAFSEIKLESPDTILKEKKSMFSGSKKVEAEEVSSSNNIIGKGTFIKGEIETSSNIRIEGKIKGNVVTKSKLVMGDTASLEGNIQAHNAEISGYVHGKIEVSELLVLKSTAVVKGDIITNKLSVENGANFNGTTKMGAATPDINLSEHVPTAKAK